MSTMLITSNGTARGTEVFVNGQRIDHVSRVEIAPILPGCRVRATITVNSVMLRTELAQADIVEGDSVECYAMEEAI